MLQGVSKDPVGQTWAPGYFLHGSADLGSCMSEKNSLENDGSWVSNLWETLLVYGAPEI